MADEDLKRWELLPILAALAAWTADANTGLFFHDWDTLPPEMNSILHAVLAIAPCLQQVAIYPNLIAYPPFLPNLSTPLLPVWARVAWTIAAYF